MNILRRLFLALFGIGLGFTLLATAWAHVGVSTIGNRNTVKSWLGESGFYDNVVETILEAANKEQAEKGESTIPVDNPQIQAVAKNAFSPSFLQENVEKVLDGTYAWLEGDTPKPEFVIDLAEAKQQLADGLSSYAVTHAASLPACTPDQVAELTDGFDVLNATCMPPGANAQMAAAELKNEILTSEEFLGDTTFSGDDLAKNSDTDISNQFENAPKAYRIASYGPYVFGTLSVLLALAVLFLSASKRRGVQRVGIIMIVSGVILGFSHLAINRGSSWLSNRAQDLSGETTAGKELAAGLVKVINQDISSLLLWYSIGFIAFGALGVLVAAIYKRGGKKLKQSTDPEPPIDDSPKVNTAKGDEEPAKAADKPTEAKKPRPPTKIQL